MIPKIITVSQNSVIIDESILGIPEFKSLLEYSGGDTLPFMYIWALTDPESPYMNLSELEREEQVLKDMPIQEYLNSLEFIEALEKADLLYKSPLRRILKGAKTAIENVSKFLEETEISDGREGNLTQVVSTIKSLPQILKGYQDAENAYKQEIQKGRGFAQFGIDELE